MLASWPLKLSVSGKVLHTYRLQGNRSHRLCGWYLQQVGAWVSKLVSLLVHVHIPEVVFFMRMRLVGPRAKLDVGSKCWVPQIGSQWVLLIIVAYRPDAMDEWVDHLSPTLRDQGFPTLYSCKIALCMKVTMSMHCHWSWYDFMLLGCKTLLNKYTYICPTRGW